jgi:hypothetical protein
MLPHTHGNEVIYRNLDLDQPHSSYDIRRHTLNRGCSNTQQHGIQPHPFRHKSPHTLRLAQNKTPMRGIQLRP